MPQEMMDKRIPKRKRERIEMQGFVGLDDEVLTEVGPWLRVAPAITMLWVALGTLLASPGVLWALTIVAVPGMVLPYHSFDALYNHGLRHLLGTRPLPVHRAPRRFSIGVAAAWAALAGLAFYTGHIMLGYGLGATLAGLAAVVSTTDFCLGAFLYGRLFGWPVACGQTVGECSMAGRRW